MVRDILNGHEHATAIQGHRTELQLLQHSVGCDEGEHPRELPAPDVLGPDAGYFLFMRVGRAGLHEPLLGRLAALNAATEQLGDVFIVIDRHAALIEHEQSARESLEHGPLPSFAARKCLLGVPHHGGFLAGAIEFFLQFLHERRIGSSSGENGGIRCRHLHDDRLRFLDHRKSGSEHGHGDESCLTRFSRRPGERPLRWQGGRCVRILA